MRLPCCSPLPRSRPGCPVAQPGLHPRVAQCRACGHRWLKGQLNAQGGVQEGPCVQVLRKPQQMGHTCHRNVATPLLIHVCVHACLRMQGNCALRVHLVLHHTSGVPAGVNVCCGAGQALERKAAAAAACARRRPPSDPRIPPCDQCIADHLALASLSSPSSRCQAERAAQQSHHHHTMASRACQNLSCATQRAAGSPRQAAQLAAAPPPPPLRAAAAAARPRRSLAVAAADNSDAEVAVFRFTLGSDAADALVPRVVGGVGAALLLLNHLLGDQPSEAQASSCSCLVLVLSSLPCAPALSGLCFVLVRTFSLLSSISCPAGATVPSKRRVPLRTLPPRLPLPASVTLLIARSPAAACRGAGRCPGSCGFCHPHH